MMENNARAGFHVLAAVLFFVVGNVGCTPVVRTQMESHATVAARPLSPEVPGGSISEGESGPADSTSLAPPQPLTSPTAIEQKHQDEGLFSASTKNLGLAPAEGNWIQPHFLYLAKDRLVRWNYQTERNEILLQPLLEIEGRYMRSASSKLPGSVLAYAADAVGEKIAILRSKGMTANGVDLLGLSIFHYPEMLISVLLDDVSRIRQISLSPDGKWLAYKQGQPGSIFLLSSEPDNLQDLTEICNGAEDAPCEGVTWTYDSSYLSWSDREGLWQLDLNSHQVSRLSAVWIEVSDDIGGTSQVKVSWTPVAWSPHGRYLLCEVTPLDSNVHWYSVLDTYRGQEYQVPGTYSLDTRHAKATWLPDGRLVVGYRPVDGDGLALSFFQLLPAHEGLFYQQKVLHVPAELASENNEQASIAEVVFIGGRVIGLRLYPVDGDTPARLFKVDWKYNSWSNVLEIPTGVLEVDWLPDGRGVIGFGSDLAPLYGDFSDGSWYDLSHLFGSDFCCIHWLR